MSTGLPCFNALRTSFASMQSSLRKSSNQRYANARKWTATFAVVTNSNAYPSTYMTRFGAGIRLILRRQGRSLLQLSLHKLWIRAFKSPQVSELKYSPQRTKHVAIGPHRQSKKGVPSQLCHRQILLPCWDRRSPSRSFVVGEYGPHLLNHQLKHKIVNDSGTALPVRFCFSSSDT